MLRCRTAGIDTHDMRRTNSVYILVDGRLVLRVIEHEEIGELLLVQFARHPVQGEQAVRHGGEGEEPLAAVPHDDVESEMIARQRQNAILRAPDRDREWAAQHRPDSVAELLPRAQQDPRVRPRHRFPRGQSNADEHLVAIVEPHVGRDQRSARSAIRLVIGLVFGRHTHQYVHEADAAVDDDVRSIRTVRAERICHAFELGPAHRMTIETKQSGDCAHGEAARRLTLTPPNAASRVKPAASCAANDSLLANLDPGVSGERAATRVPPRGRACSQCRVAAASHAQPRRAADKARSSQSVPTWSTAQATHCASSMGEPTNCACRAPRPGEQPAGGRKRTASRASRSMIAASRR